MRKILTLLFALLFCNYVFAQLKVDHLLTEDLPNPLSIDALTPRFSWQLNAGNQRNVMQTAYEINVSDGKHKIWSSGKVASDQSAYVDYKGEALKSSEKYTWQVRVWDNAGKPTAWSMPATFKMGLLTPTDWKAQWITPDFVEDSVMRPSPLFRKEFQLKKKIKSATAYITAHGLYEAQINGHRVGNAYLTPGWTSYNKRLQYQAYDVTGLLKNGANAVGATLGSGWYRGAVGYNPTPNLYGKDIALLFQLQVRYTDGTVDYIVSDGSWKSSTGPIRFAQIYNGAIIDNNELQPGWAGPGFNDKAWDGVKVRDYDKSNLVATVNEPVREHETFKPVKIFTTPQGDKVIDFGQNLVGWVKFKVSGKAGDKVIISHAEVIDKTGNFYTANLRSARCQDIYVLKGGGEEDFEPRFTWQGFRYIKIEGYPGELKEDNFTAVALYSDMKPMGAFSCSNAMINQLQHNIQWGQKGNFLDVPTDCPQRDERLGWTGDAQVFSRTASYNMNVHNFFTKWLKDVAVDQYPDGRIPHVIPDVLPKKGAGNGGSAGWSDVATIVPWNMYLAYGDKRILENQFSSMKSWVNYMHNQSKNDLWQTGSHFGDWLFYSRNDDNDGESAITSKYLIAQCFFAYSTQLVINAATVLHKDDDVTYYTDLLSKVKQAYVREYVTANGLISSDTQTAYVLALAFDMLPENLRTQAADRLAANVMRYGMHLTTGFLGTPYLCGVLTKFGHPDIAYRLLLQDTYPSWLYPVKMGATTIWERWDGIKTDGTFETPTMNSYNHYAYGAIGDWMYRTVAGIDTKTEGAGYKEIVVKPVPGGNLSFVNADYETNYGKVSSHWKADGGNFELDVEIPANTTATVYVPVHAGSKVTSDDKSVDDNSKRITDTSGLMYQQINVGSGIYHFMVSGY